jgi:hypothetical protein
MHMRFSFSNFSPYRAFAIDNFMLAGFCLFAPISDLFGGFLRAVNRLVFQALGWWVGL